MEILMSGFSAASFATACSTPSATTVSLEPLLRNTLKPMTSLPFKRAWSRTCSLLSRTAANSDSLTNRPPPSEIGVSASCCRVCALFSTRMDCSCALEMVRPAGMLALVCASCAFTCSAVMPSAFRRSGFRAMWISRFAPPMRVTCCTPRTANSSRLTVSSINHDSSAGLIFGAWTT